MTFAEFTKYMQETASNSGKTIFELSNGDEVYYDSRCEYPRLNSPVGFDITISWETAYDILYKDGQFDDQDED